MKKIEVFDFCKNWDMVKTHLRNEELVEILNDAMDRYILNEIDRLKEEGYSTELMDKKLGFDFNKGDYPYQLCSSDGIFCRACDTTPEHGTYRSFQLLHGCHWIVDWAVKLGEIMFPELEWDVMWNDRHSIAIAYDNKGRIVKIFDILLFQHYDVDYILDFADCSIEDEDFYDMYRDYKMINKHIFDGEYCTCWGNNKELYKKQYDDMIEEMEKWEQEWDDDEEECIL